MQKEDGRVTAHGWSLPSKYKVGDDGLMFRNVPHTNIYSLISPHCLLRFLGERVITNIATNA